MTTKKYVLIFIVFASLLTMAAFFFVGGLSIKEESEIAF